MVFSVDSSGEAMSSPGTIKGAQGVFKEQLRRASAVVETQDKTAPPLATQSQVFFCRVDFILLTQNSRTHVTKNFLSIL